VKHSSEAHYCVGSGLGIEVEAAVNVREYELAAGLGVRRERAKLEDVVRTARHVWRHVSADAAEDSAFSSRLVALAGWRFVRNLGAGAVQADRGETLAA
jgi:hypothetical protein